MTEGPSIAVIGALIGDPARATILTALLDGRAWTATELSVSADVSRPTTSGHLRKLVDGNLLVTEKQGRHRYFRLANYKVAEALEALAGLAADIPQRRPKRSGPRDQAMRTARTCYDHLAGRLGVGLMENLSRQAYLAESEQGLFITEPGELWFRSVGIDLAHLRSQRRVFARPCLDWSERRPHLAGAAGAALAAHYFDQGWIERLPNSRALKITSKGHRGFRESFGIDLTEQPGR